MMFSNSRVRDFFWYWGFWVFCELRHPISIPGKILRRMIVSEARSFEPLASEEKIRKIPKKIWIYWAQGWESAPSLTKICRESWIKNNPDWEVISLSEDTLREHLSFGDKFNGRDIPHAAYSDVVRVGLLARYGGVWVDATTFCSSPLDDWLPKSMQSGFFAFSKPKTTIASWFLAAEEENVLVQEWWKYIESYWKFATKPNRYFWVHYLFEYLIRNDFLARGVWDKTPRVSSDEPYAAQRCLKRGGDVECAEIISTGLAPVHKLDWKIGTPEIFLRTVETQASFPVDSTCDSVLKIGTRI